MTVTIAGNLRREKIQIDADGNEVRPFTRDIIKPAEVPYQPTREEMESAAAKKGGEQKLSKEEILGDATKPTLNIEAIIAKKIEALVEKKVNEVLEKLLK